MSLRTDLATFLQAQAAIAAIVGSRVYWQTAPQRTALPCLVFQKISDEPNFDLQDGEGNLLVSNWQIEALVDAAADATGATIEALDAAIRGALTDYTGLVGATTVRDIRRRNHLDGFEPPPAAAERPINRSIHEFQIWYEA